MPVVRTPEEVEALWQKARAASEDGESEYAEGVYATVQWLIGVDDEPQMDS